MSKGRVHQVRCWIPGVVAAAVMSLGGCANGIPEGSLSYYLPKAETTLTVTQTLTCNSDNSLLQVVNVVPGTTYSSDVQRGPEWITPRQISGPVSDADISFSLTDDGRLSGVNVSTTGQGGAIVKDVLAVAKAAALTAAAATPDNVKKACEVIGKFSGKGAKPAAANGGAKGGAAAGKTDGDASSSPSVTLTFQKYFGYDTSSVPLKAKDPGGPQAGTFDSEFGPDLASQTIYEQLHAQLPLLGFDFDVVSSPKMAAPAWADGRSDLVVKLNSVAVVTLKVRGLKGDLKAPNREPIWSGDVLVPLTRPEDLVHVPIPKAAFFGARKFSLSLSNYGTITKIGYVSTGTSDTADALGAIGSAVAGTTKSPTAAQQAAALQAQSDLIFQQQRLANCLAKPESCSSK